MTHFPAQCSVYWFDPEPSKGSELKKVRPCVVISPDEMNKYLRTVLVIPLTTNMKDWPFRATVNILGRKSKAACDQMRVVDRSRLKARIGELKKSDKKELFALLQSVFQLTEV